MAENREAVMIVDGWSTSCSACRRSTEWDEEGHMTVLGFGPDNGEQGCGAKWSGVYFVYGRPVEWPEHMPVWMADLPEAGPTF